MTPLATVVVLLLCHLGATSAARGADEPTSESIAQLLIDDQRVSSDVTNALLSGVEPEPALRGDLTGDGVAELVVLVDTSGAGRAFGYYVIEFAGPEPRVIHAVNLIFLRPRLRAVGVQLEERTSLADPSDPPSFPSAGTLVRTFAFDEDAGRMFLVERRAVLRRRQATRVVVSKASMQSCEWVVLGAMRNARAGQVVLDVGTRDGWLALDESPVTPFGRFRLSGQTAVEDCFLRFRVRYLGTIGRKPSRSPVLRPVCEILAGTRGTALRACRPERI